MNTRQIREFRRILRRFERVTSTQLRNCCAEVTLPQCLVLMEVDEAERLTVGQLASRLRLDNSTLSRTIDNLVRIGLLDRSRDDDDRRIVWIRLTEAGEATCAAIHAENDAMYRKIFARIPRSKRNAVVRNFGVLVQAFLDSESEAAGECIPSASKVASGEPG